MKIRLVLLAAAIAAVPTFANAQSTTAQGAANGAAAGDRVGGPVGAIVGGTVGAAVGAAVEIPNALIMSVQRADVPSVVVRERIVVGEPLPATVQLRTRSGLSKLPLRGGERSAGDRRAALAQDRPYRSVAGLRLKPTRMAPRPARGHLFRRVPDCDALLEFPASRG